ncbi:hypothetical protein Nepgr_001927 [Nepenthes gracilis]|uniref:Dirigent protein n=1 Tax=Nepenthes gracilis TaxID=150966 RepID=A0AAD3P602_NEPGR|nr:hypothetical protein Nepgr_001927 [Nepenthes gracilis]
MIAFRGKMSTQPPLYSIAKTEQKHAPTPFLQQKRRSVYFYHMLSPLRTSHLPLLPISFAGINGGFARTFSPEELGLYKQKLSQFRLYWHDVVNESNPTSVAIVSPPMNTSTAFGFVTMIDNPLTEGPGSSSKWIGRAQGFYASASQEEVGLLMAMNSAIMEGKYNGSTITVFGMNMVFSKVRKMPVIGGKGLFRFARGYVQARTHSSDPTTG